MVIHRTKNAARNIVADGALKVVNMLLPFLTRSIVLYYLGVEYLGLGGLFYSTLQILNLAEMGVGTAMVFSMYRPIAEDDTETVCALMRLYRKYYRLIGLFVAVAGMALTPFLRGLIRGHVPADVNLYILYYMNLAATVFSYWLFAYKNCLFNAHQRIDVASRITIVVNVTQFILQLLSLMLFRNYYLFLAFRILAQIATNILISLRAGKMYPQYKPRGFLPEETVKKINRRIRDFFTSRFSATIFTSVDTLVISAYMGLTILAVYQNYNYIVSALRSILDVVLGACIAGVGNSLVTETPEKNYRDMKRISLLFGWIMCVFSSMLLCLYQPFMRLWMGEENLLDFRLVIFFTVFFFSVGINRLINMFKDAAGIWRRDRFRPLTAAVVNLALNLILVRRHGLYGVLLASVISIVIVQIPWLIYNLFHELFPVEYMRGYVLDLCATTGVAFMSCLVSYSLCRVFELNDWLTLLVNGCISFAVPNLFCSVVYGRNPLFGETVRHVTSILFSRKK